MVGDWRKYRNVGGAILIEWLTSSNDFKKNTLQVQEIFFTFPYTIGLVHALAREVIESLCLGFIHLINIFPFETNGFRDVGFIWEYTLRII